MDIVHKRGMEIDLHRLPEMLGVPAIPVSGRSRTGLQTLMHTAAHHAPEREAGQAHPQSWRPRVTRTSTTSTPWFTVSRWSTRSTCSCERLDKRYPGIQNTRWRCHQTVGAGYRRSQRSTLWTAPGMLDRSYETEIINEKYAFIEEMIHEVLFRHEEKEEMTDRVDRMLDPPLVWPAYFLVHHGLCVLPDTFPGRLAQQRVFQVLLTGLSNGTHPPATLDACIRCGQLP